MCVIPLSIFLNNVFYKMSCLSFSMSGLFIIIFIQPTSTHEVQTFSLSRQMVLSHSYPDTFTFTIDQLFRSSWPSFRDCFGLLFVFSSSQMSCSGILIGLFKTYLKLDCRQSSYHGMSLSLKTSSQDKKISGKNCLKSVHFILIVFLYYIAYTINSIASELPKSQDQKFRITPNELLNMWTK